MPYVLWKLAALSGMPQQLERSAPERAFFFPLKEECCAYRDSSMISYFIVIFEMVINHDT